MLANGTAGQMLRSNGTTLAPSWISTSGLSVGTATNLAGGLAGQIPYQSAAGTTAMLANGTAGQILQSNGTVNPPSWVTAPLGDMTLAGNQTVTGAKTFGIFGKAAGLAADENVLFSKELIALAADLASFNNTSVDDAITALGAGLRGENEPLRRFGVLLDDATLRAKALEMGIYDGNGSLTAQQKILAANSAIFEQTIKKGLT
jgi:hypothetical protein